MSGDIKEQCKAINTKALRFVLSRTREESLIDRAIAIIEDCQRGETLTVIGHLEN